MLQYIMVYNYPVAVSRQLHVVILNSDLFHCWQFNLSCWKCFLQHIGSAVCTETLNINDNTLYCGKKTTIHVLCISVSYSFTIHLYTYVSSMYTCHVNMKGFSQTKFTCIFPKCRVAFLVHRCCKNIAHLLYIFPCMLPYTTSCFAVRS